MEIPKLPNPLEAFDRLVDRIEATVLDYVMAHVEKALEAWEPADD